MILMARYSNGLEDTIDLSPSAITVLESRYLKKDSHGKATETAHDMFMRVADNIAQADKNYRSGSLDETTEKFYRSMSSLHFLPNSPTLMNAGRELQQLSACFVLPVPDSIDGIFEAAKQGAIVHKSGGGTGYSFSKLRPKGDIVGSTQGVASGPVSFMSAFNVYTDVVKQGGTRRGANMGILSVSHPDIMEFIDAKCNPDDKAKMIAGQFGDSKYVHGAVARALVENYQLNNFNLSVAVTDKFMEAVEKGTKYDLIHPVTGKVVRTIDARKVFEKIAQNGWRTAEPGVIFIDTINKYNPTPGVGQFDATNPCAEQPLLPYESCNLGSIDVSKFVKDGKIDYQGLEAVVKNSIHFLDNVVDMNHAPIPQINEMTRANRKVGLGIMGFADALIYMGIPYGSHDSIQVAEQLTKFIQDASKDASRELARERGSFPNIDLSIYKGQDMRNATTTTIAPTGTIGIITGCSQGIEPLYSVVVSRRTGEFTLFEPSKVFEKKLREAGIEPTKEMLEQILKNGGPKGIVPPEIADIFVTAGDLSAEQHIKVQAAFQRHIDNAVSKTINMPNSATVEDIEKAYALAYKSGLKGITIYRDGSRGTQVLNVGPDKVRKSLQTILTEEALKTERPEIVKGETLTSRTSFGKLFMTINRRPDGTPYEIFCAIGKSGGDIGAMAEGYGRLMSRQLQGGSTLEDIAEQLGGIGGKSAVFDNGHSVTSLPDAISKTIKRHIEHYEKGNGHHVDTKSVSEISGNMCPKCHSPLIATEGCEKCSTSDCDYSKCS